MAVLTDGNPSHEYGTETLRGVAQRVFARPHATVAEDPELAGSPATRRAGLVDVHRHAPGIQVELDYLAGNNITGRRLPGYCRELGAHAQARPRSASARSSATCAGTGSGS